MKKTDTHQQRPALAGWDDDGGASPSDQGLAAETERERRLDHADELAAFDATHDSSARGEHRYPAAHQTEAQQRAKTDRDALKRKLRGTR
jgi:hypothetical protein